MMKGHSVSIIGAGRLGTALGLALKAAGYQIEVVVARRPSAARRAGKVFGSRTLALAALQPGSLAPHQQLRLDQSSLFLVTTPDDVIEPLAKQLASIFRRKPIRFQKRAAGPRRVILHTSGALSSAALKPMRAAGFVTGSLHPLVSISDSRSGAKALRHAFFSVEGEPAAVRVAKSIVRDLAGVSFTIDSRDKALYHAAAVIASPHMTALFDIAVETLCACGLNPRRARRILLPLLESTVTNLHTQDPTAALTGTFKRGDVATVRKHLAALKAANLPAALEAYLVLGQRSVSIAQRRKPKRVELDEIARILARATKRIK